ncbi:hypothetical protein D7I44_06060 [Gryllotalpicola protaetiae]|uniref:DUF2273 domain-containing protein n=1 Tax=Gryllotalpicola protaetiae TaxID=2419771 RepID=A0A387BWK4_9MICO|nr:hypothetical protein [Gryllotalpicola protaetiae]AYG05289.1 hypothetical protein D7I44_06060 [Gryllotalpicola protaetiae]
MSATKVGIFVGAILAVVWFALGFWAFFFAAIAMILGALVGRIIDGKLDMRSLVDTFRGKRTSS